MSTRHQHHRPPERKDSYIPCQGGEIGRGAFGKVIRVVHESDKSKVLALKSSLGDFKRDGTARDWDREIKILKVIAEEDPKNRKFCARLIDSFQSQDPSGKRLVHMVFPLLGPSVFDFMEKNNFSPFPVQHVKEISYQLLSSLAFLRNLGIVHCDIKDDNILFVDNDYQKDAHGTRIFRNPKICLNDFGKAVSIGGKASPSGHIQNIYFRAPEVMAGIPWRYGVDVFTAAELIHQIRCGTRYMPDGLNLNDRDNAKAMSVLTRIQNTEFPMKLLQMSREKPMYLTNIEKGTIDQKLKQDARLLVHKDDVHWKDLMRRLTQIDPDVRCAAADALQHSFFSGVKAKHH